MRARLGVNIDHVATLRQARGESYPRTSRAAQLALDSGADQITIHLREDRRHIQDHDLTTVKAVTDSLQKPLNLELGINDEIISIACELRPDWICIVPEKREERTTEGGLNLLDENYISKLRLAIDKMRKQTPTSKISLFIEANLKNIEALKSLGVDAVEIHTGDYAKDHLEGNDISGYLNNYSKYYKLIKDTNMSFHAGHGLTDESLKPLCEQGLFVEYNIGHWIVSESVYLGMEKVIKNLLNIMEQS